MPTLGDRWRVLRSRATRRFLRRSLARMVTFKSVEFVGTTVVTYVLLDAVGDGGAGGVLVALGAAFLTDFVIPGAWYVLNDLLWHRHFAPEASADAGT